MCKKKNFVKAIVLLLSFVLVAVAFSSCEIEKFALIEKGLSNNESALTFVCFSAGNKELSWSEVVDAVDTEECIWYYTAEKVDNGKKIGETTEQVKVGSNGKLSEENGPFSLGYWTFTLYGYTDDKLAYVGEIEKVELTKQNDMLIQYLPFEFEEQVDENATGTIIVSGDICYYSCDREFAADTVALKNIENGTEEVFALEKGTDLVIDNLSAGLYIVAVQDRGIEGGTEFTYAEGKLALNVKPNSTITVTGTIEELLGYVKFEVTVNEDAFETEYSEV